MIPGLPEDMARWALNTEIEVMGEIHARFLAKVAEDRGVTNYCPFFATVDPESFLVSIGEEFQLILHVPCPCGDGHIGTQLAKPGLPVSNRFFEWAQDHDGCPVDVGDLNADPNRAVLAALARVQALDLETALETDIDTVKETPDDH